MGPYSYFPSLMIGRIAPCPNMTTPEQIESRQNGTAVLTTLEYLR